MSDSLLVYVGTYTEPIRFGTGAVLQGKGEGIHLLRLDPASGALTPLGIAASASNPSYLAFDASQRFLYAVNELKSWHGRPTGAVSAFAVDPANGSLTVLNQQPTHGTDPCHVTVDRARRHAFVANFMSGSVCVLPIRDDGGLDAASDFIQHVGAGIDPQRQTGPHAHSVTLDATGRFAFVPDLGLDKVMIYAFDPARGMLEPHGVPWLKQRPGSGPRHLALHPNGRFAYLINELGSTVAVLRRGGTTGTQHGRDAAAPLTDPAPPSLRANRSNLDRPEALTDRDCFASLAMTADGPGVRHGDHVATLQHLQTLSTLPTDFAGANTCADIHVHPSGWFVYASNRGHDSIAAFCIDPATGMLTPAGHVATQGRTPRSFCLDPTGRLLLVANQDSDSVVSFRIDAQTGALHPTGHSAAVPTPVCVKIRTHPASRGPSWHP